MPCGYLRDCGGRTAPERNIKRSLLEVIVIELLRRIEEEIAVTSLSQGQSTCYSRYRAEETSRWQAWPYPRQSQRIAPAQMPDGGLSRQAAAAHSGRLRI